jgi:hypothetical protein
MATSVTVNGTTQNVGPDGRTYVTVDATVGSAHHQVKFLKDDLLKFTSAAALQKFVAQQCKSVDTASGGLTGLSDSLLDLRGTVSV